MTSRFPALDGVLASLALGLLLTFWLLPPTPWLASSLRPWALGLNLVWVGWRLAVLDRALARWRAWRVGQSWLITPASLTRPHTVVLGKGFRWHASHVEQLERVLLDDKGLPEWSDDRGGYPGLHAVGLAEEADVTISWTNLTTHLGLFGTTGSGKSTALEMLLTQAVALS